MNIAILEPDIAASEAREPNGSSGKTDTRRADPQAFDLHERSVLITPLLDEILHRRPSFPQPFPIDDRLAHL